MRFEYEYLFMFSHCSDFIYNAWNCARKREREGGREWEKEWMSEWKKERERKKEGKKDFSVGNQVWEDAFVFCTLNIGYFGPATSGFLAGNSFRRETLRENKKKPSRTESRFFFFASHEEASRESRFWRRETIERRRMRKEGGEGVEKNGREKLMQIQWSSRLLVFIDREDKRKKKSLTATLLLLDEM